LVRAKGNEIWDLLDGKRVAIIKHHRIVEYAHPRLWQCFELAFLPDGKHFVTVHGDWTALVWELPPDALKPPSQRIHSQTWDDLASLDARVGHSAVWALRNEPAKALTLMKEKLRPATMPDAKELAAIVDQLSDKEYAKREAALKRLHTYGQTIEPFVRDSINRTSDPEKKKRLNQLLEDWRNVASRTPEEIRAIRCIEALEQIKNPDATRLLAELSKGAPSAILTREAKQALEMK
jgi:hypothetical protein